MGNKNLHNAKNSKNDEFYTQYTDIQKEVDAYLEYNPNVFRDKTILFVDDLAFALEKKDGFRL